MDFEYFLGYIKVRAVMGIDLKLKKIHDIVQNSGSICKKSSGKLMLLSM